MSEQLRLVAQADATHTQYPQYANHWDGWSVVTIRRTVLGRGRRVLFEKGDRVLLDPRGIQHEDYYPPSGYIKCYSWRAAVDCMIRPTDIVETIK